MHMTSSSYLDIATIPSPLPQVCQDREQHSGDQGQVMGPAQRKWKAQSGAAWLLGSTVCYNCSDTCSHLEPGSPRALDSKKTPTVIFG